MKKVRININQIGLVLKNNDFVTLLETGKYWFFKGESILIFEKGSQFESPIDVNVLLQYSEVKDALEILEIADNEIVIQFEDKIFKSVLTAGKYFFWKGLRNYKFEKHDISKIEIEKSFDVLLLSRLSNWVRTFTVESYERGLLILDGKLSQFLEPGTYYWWKNASSIQVAKTDIRQQQIEISGQEILTKDKAPLRINFYVQYQVKDIEKALFMNKEYDKQLYVLMQFALRAYVGAFTLDELLDKKDLVSEYVIKNAAEQVSQLGIEVKNAGIRDIILPGEMKEIMNQELIAEKKAQANIIMRREETASMRSLLNTAKIMEENETLWKLKEMEYVEKIADKINTISVSGNGQILDQLKQIFVKN